MKKIILLLAMFVLCASFVSAAESFESEVTIIKDSIKLDESAQFLVTIKSNSSQIEQFSIYCPDVEWNVPLKTIRVDPGSTAGEKVEIFPRKTTTPGVYGVHLNIKKEGTEELDEKLVLVTVAAAGDQQYLPSVRMEVDMVRQVDPRQPFVIRINLENQNILNLTSLTLAVSSDLSALNRQQEIELASLEKKVVELSYDLDPQQQPKAYIVSFALMRGNETIASPPESKTVEIVSVTPEFKSSYEEEKSFLKSVLSVTYLNDGNVRNTQTVKIPTSWFASLFTKTAPEATIVKDEAQKYFAWEFELGSEESETVVLSTNYRSIAVVIIIIIIALLAYAKYRKRVIVRKSIANVSIEEGGISHLKIMVDVVNSTGKEIKDVKIVDIIPTIADVIKEFGEGTLKPVSLLKHTAKGTMLKWELPELAAGEERLLTYDIRTKLSILGSFTLPRAKLKYSKDGKEKVVTSNSVGVSA